jgi:polyhydroxybutyrate depolymerase
LFLHGLGATGQLGFDILKLQDLGKRHQAFVLAPDGSLDSKGRRFWNAHPACCNFDQKPVDHVAYLSELIDEVTTNYPVDKTHLYVIGFSNGAFMAHRLACEWGERVAGIVSVAGAGPASDIPCRTPQGLKVLEMHGDADQTVFYAGGTLFDRPNATYSSAPDTFKNWAKRLGCRNRLAITGTPIDLVPTLPGAETDTLTQDHCPYGTVALWTVHGGSHLFGNRPNVLEQAWLFLTSDPR